MNKRYYYIDCVKGFAIISVVLGHLFTMVLSSDPMPYLGNMVRFLSIYELAVFFMVSGFLMAEKTPEALKFSSYFVKRAKKYLAVYFVFSFLYVFSALSWTNILYIVSGFGLSVLWFLPTIMLAEAVFLLLRKAGKLWVRMGISLALAVAVCACGPLVQGVEGDISPGRRITGCVLVLILRALAGQMFVGLGYLLNGFIRKYSKSKSAILMAGCFVVGIVCGMGITTADWRVMNIREPVFWLLAASAVSTGLILLFSLLERYRLRILEQIGRESLLIMCTHLQFGILPACITLGYRVSEKVCALLPYFEGFAFWGTILVSLAAMETVLILIKRYGYRY